MRTNDYFGSISVLRNTVLSDNTLRVIHSHRVWVASFVWTNPVPTQSIRDVEIQLRKKIPEDFYVFLNSVSDGAILYRDVEDEMTGYKIFGIGELLERQEKWMQSLDGLWLPQFIAIGEITSENRPLIMDTNAPTKDGKSCKLIEGSAYDPVEYWQELSQSFQDWIDHLVTAQGAQYWLWH